MPWLVFLLSTSFRNLWRAPKRTAISLAAIAAAVAALILFQSFVEGVRSTFRESVITSRFGHYQVYPEGARKSHDPFAFRIKDPEAVRTAIEKDVGQVKFISRQQQFFGLVSNGEQSTGGVGLGIDAAEEKKFLTLTQVHEGKHLADVDGESLFIGYEFAERLGIKVGQFVTVVVTTATGSINALDFEVVGTFKSGVTEMDQQMFFIHFGTAEELLQTEGAQRLLIGFDTEDELALQPQLASTLGKKFPGLELIHWQALAAYFDNTMGWLDSIFKVFRVIIVLIATLSIVNVFTITLMERVGEFGTLRAIGTGRGEIIGMVLAEGLMQAFLGSLIGVAAGIGAITTLLSSGVKMPPPLMMSVPFQVDFGIPWEGVVITGLLCAAVAGSAGILPALKMARTNIVQALGRNV